MRSPRRASVAGVHRFMRIHRPARSEKAAGANSQHAAGASSNYGTEKKAKKPMDNGKTGKILFVRPERREERFEISEGETRDEKIEPPRLRD